MKDFDLILSSDVVRLALKEGFGVSIANVGQADVEFFRVSGDIGITVYAKFEDDGYVHWTADFDAVTIDPDDSDDELYYEMIFNTMCTVKSHVGHFNWKNFEIVLTRLKVEAQKSLNNAFDIWDGGK